MRPTPISQIDVVCQSCQSSLGGVANYGLLNGIQVSLRCPCGGSSPALVLGEIYELLPTGILTEDLLRAEMEDAIESCRRSEIRV